MVVLAATPLHRFSSFAVLAEAFFEDAMIEGW